MLDIICEKCGSSASIDSSITINDYVYNMETLVVNTGLPDKNIPQYFYYHCSKCEAKHKLSLHEVVNKIRDKFVRDAFKIRHDNAMSDFRTKTNNEDSGLVYCGQCFGFDGYGNCLKDMYNQCKMRRRSV